MIAFSKLNKSMRRSLIPTLKEKGFSKVDNHTNINRQQECIWVMTIKPVGKTFSAVTGWTARSLSARIGIYFPFVPPMDQDEERVEIPSHDHCQLQMDLQSSMDLSYYTRHMDETERNRRDVWWVEPNGSNLDEVIEDIKESFLQEGLPWLENLSNVKSAFAKIENKYDCYHKFHTAKYFAKYLNETKKFEKYHYLFEQEAEKFGDL